MRWMSPTGLNSSRPVEPAAGDVEPAGEAARIGAQAPEALVFGDVERRHLDQGRLARRQQDRAARGERAEVRSALRPIGEAGRGRIEVEQDVGEPSASFGRARRIASFGRSIRPSRVIAKAP